MTERAMLSQPQVSTRMKPQPPLNMFQAKMYLLGGPESAHIPTAYTLPKVEKFRDRIGYADKRVLNIDGMFRWVSNHRRGIW